jgi:gas vesicle protein
MRTDKIILGTLAGLAIGAIAGILLAPEKGSTTRKNIMDMGDEYVDKLKLKFDEFGDSLAEKLDSTKKIAENLVEKGKAKYNEQIKM